MLKRAPSGPCIGCFESCPQAVLLAGARQVDIINYSIAGGFRSTRLLDDPLALAFRGAAAAGIFIAAAAGMQMGKSTEHHVTPKLSLTLPPCVGLVLHVCGAAGLMCWLPSLKAAAVPAASFSTAHTGRGRSLFRWLIVGEAQGPAANAQQFGTIPCATASE